MWRIAVSSACAHSARHPEKNNNPNPNTCDGREFLLEIMTVCGILFPFIQTVSIPLFTAFLFKQYWQLSP
jgi:hypothetical protein